MIRALVEMMLGEWGTRLLTFIEANSLAFGLLVLVYGLVMMLSWQTLVRIHRTLVIAVATTVHQSPDLSRKSTHKQVRDAVPIPWQEVVDAAPFPLIGRTGALVPRRKTVENVQRLLDEDEIVDHALAVLTGTHIRKLMPSYKRIVRDEMEEKQARH